MLIGQPQLGFSVTSAFKSVGRGIATGARAGYSAASDPRLQRAAAAAAQAYAPGQYAQVTEYADRARGIIRPPMPGQPMPMQQMPMPQMPQMPMPGGDDDMGPAPGGPVQKGNMFMIAALAGAGLLVFLLLRK